MKKCTPYLFLLVLFISLSAASFAQKALQLTSTRTGRVETVGKGTELLYRLKKDSGGVTHHGVLKAINDSSIVIGDETFSVSDMEVVAVHARNNDRDAEAARIVGNGLIIAGDIVTHAGLNIFINDDFYVWPVGGTIAFVGACIWGLGLIMDEIVSPAIRENNTHAGDLNWKAEIIESQKKGKKKKKQQSSDDDLYGY